MFKKLLLGLALTFGLAKAQPLTNYSLFQWDKGTSTPSYCTEPGFYYRTDTNLLLSCTGHSFSTLAGTRLASANWVFEGDSLTSGHGLLKSADNTTSCQTSLADVTCLDWPSQFVLLSGASGAISKKIVATSGAKLADIQTRYAASIHPLSPTVTGKPAVLAVWIGSNDVTGGTAVSTFETNLSAYLTTARTTDKFSVMVFTVQRREDTADPSGADENARQLVNQWLRGQFQAGAFDYLVDIDRIMTSPWDSVLFQSDFIHETASGFYLVAKAANDTLWSDGVDQAPNSVETPVGTGHSTTAVWGATISGSSTNHVLAYCDGTVWTVAGK